MTNKEANEIIVNEKPLNEILENHNHWLRRDVKGFGSMRANLSDADLRYANLRDANLDGVNLRGVNLGDVDLDGANLRGVNLRGANLRGSKNIPYIPLQCPSDGAFIGWKKVNNVLIKLEIPADAKRSSATTNKCRCDKAKVLGFYDSLGVNELDMTELVNNKYKKCRYVKDEMVYPDFFDEDRWNKCSHGIHFLLTNKMLLTMVIKWG